MGHVFVGVHSRESLIKVIDSDLLPASSNLDIVKKYGPNKAEYYDLHLSPEEFESYVHGTTFVNNLKSAVFSLGMMILDLCLMESSHTVYHFNKRRISKS